VINDQKFFRHLAQFGGKKIQYMDRKLLKVS